MYTHIDPIPFTGPPGGARAGWLRRISYLTASRSPTARSTCSATFVFTGHVCFYIYICIYVYIYIYIYIYAYI